MERWRVFHMASLDLKDSSTLLQLWYSHNLPASWSPNYCISSVPTRHPDSEAICWTSFLSTPSPSNKLFSMLIVKLVSTKEIRKHLVICLPRSSPHRKNIIVSSQYYIMVVVSWSSQIQKLCSHLSTSNWLTKIGRDSATKLNSISKNGHPCLSPLSILNSHPPPPANPLTKLKPLPLLHTYTFI